MIDPNQTITMPSVPTDLLINGEWRSTATRFEVQNPANEGVLTDVADAGVSDAADAIEAASAAQPSWAATDPRVRGEILRRAFEFLNERAELFARLMTLEMGKPLAEARDEVTYGAEFFRWFSEETVRISGRFAMAPSGGTRLLTMKQAVGPVYAITPWNFPLAMGARKIAPALAAGCTIVVKPAALTPLTTLALASVLQESGLPDGVLNVLTTTNAGAVSERLVKDPRLRKLTFTGSTSVGKMLIQQSAQNVLRVSMELGGNAPFLVFPDANLPRAVEAAVAAKMRNMGEACTAANRFLVHASIADEFGGLLSERMRALRVGNGLDEHVQVGPLAEAKAISKIEELVDDARTGGAKVKTGGRRLPGPGHFYSPTVLTDVPPSARVFSEEIFGPVAPVTPFETEDEAVDLANRTEYGLAAYVFTSSLTRAMTITERLEAGMVAVNQGTVSNPAAPFGGVKASGLGREGGPEGIDEYLETKYVGIAL